MMEPAFRPLADGVRVRVRVTPRSRSEGVAGMGRDAGGDHFKVRVTAAPVDGAANERVIRLIAGVVGVSPSAVRIALGETGRIKNLIVTGESGKILDRLRNLAEGTNG